MRDFNPRGTAWFSVLAPWLANTYKLNPLPKEKADEQKTRFQNGEFILEDGKPPITVEITIYTGGVEVNTGHSTDASDAFFVDMFTKLSKDFGMLPYTEVIRERKYCSQLWVSTDKSLNVINPKLQNVSSSLMNLTGVNFEIGGISFWPEQQIKYPPWAFVLERAAGIPFSDNRYFSRAPTTTTQHIELLQMIENALS